MYGVFVLTVITIYIDILVVADSLINDVNSRLCYQHKDYSLNQYDWSTVKPCTIDNIPHNIDFTIILDDSDIATGTIKVEFPFPDEACIYRLSLIVNSALNEGICENNSDNYTSRKRINQHLLDFKVHTAERNVCAFSKFDNTSDKNNMQQKNVELWFQSVFTGCYALKFHVNEDEFIVRGYNFVRTDYKYLPTDEPKLHCSYYKSITDSNLKDTVYFTTSISDLTSTSALRFNLSLLPDVYKDKHKACAIHSLPLNYTWDIKVESGITDFNCSKSMIQKKNDNYIEYAECRFTINTVQTDGYCIMVRLISDRCHRNTVWYSPLDGKIPCIWMQECTKVLQKPIEHVYGSGKTNSNQYLLLPLVVVGIAISLILAVMCFSHYLCSQSKICSRIHSHKDNFVTAVCTRLDDFEVSDRNEGKDREEDNIINKDIVLLYAKDSPSFMTLMAEFREILAKTCHCSVHDLYAGNKWNAIAKVGCSAWFIEMLKNDCRIVWVDTLFARDLITYKNINRPNNHVVKYQDKHTEISDFRNVALPALLSIAKQSLQQTTMQYNKHFIVRLKNWERMKTLDDPFFDISPQVRYTLPQHLTDLCITLSASKSEVFMKNLKMEENILHDHLIRMESE